VILLRKTANRLQARSKALDLQVVMAGVAPSMAKNGAKVFDELQAKLLSQDE
jgi:division protein CdvB (Snf7/Vps24/ESCRT-III family)